ncbi:hypothetical protein FHS83_002669 [Rhizomicrobium palustre]|uniref:Uncharacterized protein n=1 Tax=Rhizomicrobium palustre TaxID=189966 RepID=A0A846N217_9PROT|nr:hypothetical protein [Rhizomicrobium palustre]NIK89351.1 hypothetical protein [Rhizomicrobium palustre]
MSTHKTRIVQGRGKAGTRSGISATKTRTKRALRHSSRVALDGLTTEADDRAEAKLADSTYIGLHPAKLAETRVLTKKKKTVKKKKKATPAAVAAKKKAAEALQKELDKAARAKAQRRAKRRAAARALKEARKD